LISKAEIKFISSLGLKKYRDKQQMFIAEGPKVIGEFLSAGFRLHKAYAEGGDTPAGLPAETVNASQLKRISQLKNPNSCLAAFHIPKPSPPKFSGLTLALDGLRDPGNLGTIIRLCDWFGVEELLCSEDTVDCYNPKVVQASMGSLARVNVIYLNLEEMLSSIDLPVFTTDMEGEAVKDVGLPMRAVLVMGNEGKGISPRIFKLADHRVTIPSFGNSKGAESLNVAMATAIILHEFRRPLTGK
jgi:TrmH family RNA methyltransferase